MLFGTYAVALLHMIRLLWDTRNFFILRKKKVSHKFLHGLCGVLMKLV